MFCWNIRRCAGPCRLGRSAKHWANATGLTTCTFTIVIENLHTDISSTHGCFVSPRKCCKPQMITVPVTRCFKKRRIRHLRHPFLLEPHLIHNSLPFHLFLYLLLAYVHMLFSRLWLFSILELSNSSVPLSRYLALKHVPGSICM